VRWQTGTRDFPDATAAVNCGNVLFYVMYSTRV